MLFARVVVFAVSGNLDFLFFRNILIFYEKMFATQICDIWKFEIFISKEISSRRLGCGLFSVWKFGFFIFEKYPHIFMKKCLQVRSTNFPFTMSACISETLIYERGCCVILVHTHEGFPLLEYCQD